MDSLSERAGIARSSIAYAEIGRKRPNLDTLELWADALGYDVVLKPRDNT